MERIIKSIFVRTFSQWMSHKYDPLYSTTSKSCKVIHKSVPYTETVQVCSQQQLWQQTVLPVNYHDIFCTLNHITLYRVSYLISKNLLLT